MKNKPIHPNLLDAVASGLEEIFVGQRYADKVIERLLKSNPKWGARDRKFIAETTYDMVRMWRPIEGAVQPWHQANPFRNAVIGWMLINNWPLPSNLQPGLTEINALRERYDALQTQAVYRESIPDWMHHMVSEELGEEKWLTELHAMNQQAQVVLRANTLKISAEELRNELAKENIHASIIDGYPDALILERRANVFITEAFKNGLFEVQDAASQLVAPFLEAEPGMRVIDACAGAGGKTLHLAALMKNKGKIIALDVEERKLTELRRRCKRAGVTIVETRLIDSTKVIKRLYDSADRVLIDAPCSGLGVLRRNPDAKWKLSRVIVDDVKQIQRDILQRYPKMVKSGKRLVYATCSILPSENELQVEGFLSTNENFKVETMSHQWPSAGFDGFFMAAITRL